jgi:hypothetical protein
MIQFRNDVSPNYDIYENLGMVIFPFENKAIEILIILNLSIEILNKFLKFVI